MIGYAASLTLVVILVNLPFGRSTGLDRGSASDSYRTDFVEPLPMITVHEIERSEPAKPSIEIAAINDELPPVEEELAAELMAAVVIDASSVVPSLPALQPALLASATDLRELGQISQYLRTALGPPPVEDAPKLRIGSLIVRYPVTALKKAIEGLVIVRFMVETDGRAYAIKVLHGLHPDCDAEVMEGVRNARFVPGRHRGRPVPAYSQMTVRFMLADSGRPIVGP